MINFLQPKIFRVLLVTHSVPLTLTVTIFGCCAFNNVLISLNEVIGNPSRSFSIFKRFNATISSTIKRRKFKNNCSKTNGDISENICLGYGLQILLPILSEIKRIN